MWDQYETDPQGAFINASDLTNARVPSLRDYVRRCAPGTTAEPPLGDGMVLKAEDRVVAKGTQVTVPVWLLNAKGVSNLDFSLSFMPEIAAPRPDAEKGNLVSDAFAYKLNQPGLFKFNFAQLTPVNSSGQVAGFRFLAVGAGRSRTPLTLSVWRINNTQGEALPVRTINGSITIYDPDDLSDPNNPNNPEPPGGSNNPPLQPTCSGTGVQTANDAQCCLKMWVGLTPRGMQMDLDNSGEVDSRDAIIVLQNVAGRALR
jgi:hypothetical protein